MHITGTEDNMQPYNRGPAPVSSPHFALNMWPSVSHLVSQSFSYLISKLSWVWNKEIYVKHLPQLQVQLKHSHPQALFLSAVFLLSCTIWYYIGIKTILLLSNKRRTERGLSGFSIRPFDHVRGPCTNPGPPVSFYHLPEAQWPTPGWVSLSQRYWFAMLGLMSSFLVNHFVLLGANYIWLSI